MPPTNTNNRKLLAELRSVLKRPQFMLTSLVDDSKTVQDIALAVVLHQRKRKPKSKTASVIKKKKKRKLKNKNVQI
jgi:hypothetical protein